MLHLLIENQKIVHDKRGIAFIKNSDSSSQKLGSLESIFVLDSNSTLD